MAPKQSIETLEAWTCAAPIIVAHDCSMDGSGIGFPWGSPSAKSGGDGGTDGEQLISLNNSGEMSLPS